MDKNSEKKEIKKNKVSSRAGNKCSLPHCGRSKRTFENLKLFRFPNPSAPLFEEWIRMCNFKKEFIEKSSSLFLCDRHFPPEYIGKRFLKQGAVPCLYLIESVDTISIKQEDELEFVDADYSLIRTLTCTSRTQSPSPMCSNCHKSTKKEEFYRKKYFKISHKLKTATQQIRDLNKRNRVLKKRIKTLDKKLKLPVSKEI